MMRALLILTLLVCSCAPKLTAADPSKYNVLFLISDDLTYTALSCYGNKVCQTPNIDRLAARGTRFTRAYCQGTYCGPSRASFMSGYYPHATGELGYRNPRPRIGTRATWSQHFINNGYHAARVSKIYHMGIPGEILVGTATRDDPHSWDEVVNIKAPEQNAPGVSTHWSPKDKGSQTFEGVEAEGDDLVHADGMAAVHAIDFLKRNKDKPFFLACGFVRPHVPLVAPAKYFDLYDRDAMEAPVVPEDDLEDVPQIIRNYKRNSTSYGVTPDLHKGLLEAYYASISYMDAQVGRVLDVLDELELSENTIVVFTSDHGYMLGEHHKFQKQHLFEESTRVPFIFSVPWMKKQHGKATNHITELLDLYPTLANLAELEAPKGLQGKSMVSILKDPASKKWKKELAFTISRNGGESIRTHDWRFTQWGFGNAGMELYDLKNDPGEFTNLASNPKYSEPLKKLQQKLELKRTAAGYSAKRFGRKKK